jgi:predicted TIM-barrel fold metal-dependent hydrolase
MTPRRAWIAAALLSLALAGVALASARVLEPHTRGYARFRPSGTWKIDFHVQADPEVLGYAVNWASSQGILGIVLLDAGHAGGGLERHLEAAARFPGRVLAFMSVDERGCCDAAWAERETMRLVTGRALGARGVHLPRALAGRDGAPVPLDDRALDPIWETLEGLGIPAAIHPGRGADARVRLVSLVERRPGISFVALQMADMAEEPHVLGLILDRLPNLLVDTAGRVPQMARDPEGTRALLVSHPDRFLLGTDLVWLQGPRPEQRALVLGSGPPVRSRDQVLRFFDSTWRFYESLEDGIPSVAAGDPPMQGLGLPGDVLLPLYRDNARKLLGFGDLEGR